MDVLFSSNDFVIDADSKRQSDDDVKFILYEDPSILDSTREDLGTSVSLFLNGAKAKTEC